MATRSPNGWKMWYKEWEKYGDFSAYKNALMAASRRLGQIEAAMTFDEQERNLVINAVKELIAVRKDFLK